MSSFKVWMIPILVLLWCDMCHSTPGELSEYCLTEIFTPHCTPDHVVVMTTAMFGRAHIGRCVTKSFGYVGCGWNAIGVLDRYCSGRRSCEVRVAPIQYDLPWTENCPLDLKRFLLAEYRCINVVNNRVSRCVSRQTLPLTQTSGTIASVVTNETGCGGPLSPWVIEGQPGQGIKVTLLDFSHGLDNTTCHEYAILEEMDGRTEKVCLGQGRERQLYSTNSHRLKVVIRSQEDLPEQAMFLLKYEMSTSPHPPRLTVALLAVCGTLVFFTLA